MSCVFRSAALSASAHDVNSRLPDIGLEEKRVFAALRLSYGPLGYLRSPCRPWSSGTGYPGSFPGRLGYPGRVCEQQERCEPSIVAIKRDTFGRKKFTGMAMPMAGEPAQASHPPRASRDCCVSARRRTAAAAVAAAAVAAAAAAGHSRGRHRHCRSRCSPC